MSKFIDEVRARITGKRAVANYEPLNVIRSREYDFTRSYDVYRIGVEWKRDIILNDSLMKSLAPQGALQLALKNVVRELRLAIYEDFELKLLGLQRAVIQGDSSKVLDLVSELLVEVRA
jgi:SNF2 family DNA or RNA helicase